MAKWHSTSFRGVRYREHSTRKHGIMPDRYFAIRYQNEGKRKEEGLGWASCGWTAEKVALELNQLKNNAKTGSGSTRLAEKRDKHKELQEKERITQEQFLREETTFSNFFNNTYAPAVKENRNKWTNAREDSLHRLWISPVIGGKPFKKISPIHLERIKKTMLDSEQSPRSVHYALAVVRQVFNYAAHISIYEGPNPVSKVKRPKYDNKRLRFLSHEEANKLLTALQIANKSVYEISLIALHCGLRAGEIFSLTWADIDFEHELLSIRDTKSGKDRTVFMTAKVKDVLAAKGRCPNNRLVFSGKGGKKLIEIPFTFRTVVANLDFNKDIVDRRHKVTFHTLRHTFASWSAMAGVDLYVMQKILGHSTIAMTERYSHLAPNKFKAATKMFENHLQVQNSKQVVNIY